MKLHRNLGTDWLLAQMRNPSTPLHYRIEIAKFLIEQFPDQFRPYIPPPVRFRLDADDNPVTLHIHIPGIPETTRPILIPPAPLSAQPRPN